jgi:hypothetical protein
LAERLLEALKPELVARGNHHREHLRNENPRHEHQGRAASAEGRRIR